jgi:hypothetical protein
MKNILQSNPIAVSGSSRQKQPSKSTALAKTIRIAVATPGVVGLLALGSPLIQAAVLFSTDVTTNQLVRIDTTTGGVTVVGDLGFDAFDVDLVTVGNKLYALNSQYNVRVDLHEINATSGASVSVVQVHRAVGTVGLAEGLAQVDGTLVIGFRDTTAPFPTRSNVLGDLGTDGLISNIRTAAASYTNVGLDFDALGVDETTGQLYGSDPTPFGSPNNTDFLTVNLLPLSRSVFYTNVSNPGLNIDDVVVLDGTLFGISDQLIALDLSTNTLSTTTLDRPGTYSGLALSAIPEPTSSFALPVVCFSGLLLHRRRRR